MRRPPSPLRLRTAAVLSAALLGLGPAGALAQERFRRVPPPPEPTPELRLPNIETVTLNNGLALSVVFRDGQPFINIQLIVQAGEALSPSGLPGIASVTANLVPRGTVEHTASEIREMIETLGGSFSVDIRLDHIIFTLQCLEEHLDPALDLLSQMVLRTMFSQVELDLLRLSMFYDLVEQEKDAAFVAKRHLLRELFRNHAYGRAVFNKSILKNIRLQDVARFFRANYFPNRSHVILTGNLSLRTAVRKVSHYFNTWARGPSAPPSFAPPPAAAEARIIFIDVPRTSGGMIYLGNIAPAMTSPDSYPLSVFHQVLGGSVNSRLILNLRESKGYAYYVFSQVEAFPGFSVFFIRARVAPPFVYEAIREIMDELRADQAGRLSTVEVEQAKSFFIGNFPLTVERLDQLAAKAAEAQTLGLGDDYWNRFRDNILQVSPERVFDMARSLPLLTPVVVIVGDKTVLADQLKYFDKVDIFDAQGVFQYSLVKETDK